MSSDPMWQADTAEQVLRCVACQHPINLRNGECSAGCPYNRAKTRVGTRTGRFKADPPPVSNLKGSEVLDNSPEAPAKSDIDALEATRELIELKQYIVSRILSLEGTYRDTHVGSVLNDIMQAVSDSDISQPQEHRPTISYTNDDDGLHLTCSCGLDTSLGFTPSVKDINDAWAAHIESFGLTVQ